MALTTAGLVVYRTPAAKLIRLMDSLHACTAAWVLVDHSADQNSDADERRAATEMRGGIYLPGENRGFGAGHNRAMHHLQSIGHTSQYHLIVNPDIEFEPGVLAELESVLNEREHVVWAMPKIVYQSGRVQHLCKLLPTPLDLFVRRFAPALFERMAPGWQDRYELHALADVANECVPHLSGCFALARWSALLHLGGFDERYFMYMEDVDICRRMATRGSLLYWPAVQVTHGYEKGSYKSAKLTLYHVASAIRYFMRWGWIFDRDRDLANARALSELARAGNGTDLALEQASRHITVAR